MIDIQQIVKRLFTMETYLTRFILVITMAMLTAMVVIIFIAVVLRYGFNIALIFSYDVSTILFAWLIFLGLAVAEYDNAHLGIDIVNKLPSANLRKLVFIIRYALLLATAIYLCYVGFMLVSKTGNQIPSLRISATWLYTALPLGFGLLSISYLIRLIKLISTKAEI